MLDLFFVYSSLIMRRQLLMFHKKCRPHNCKCKPYVAYSVLSETNIIDTFHSRAIIELSIRTLQGKKGPDNLMLQVK